MLSSARPRTQQRSNRSIPLGDMDYADPKKKSNIVRKFLMAATLTAMCILMLKQSPNFSSPGQFSRHEPHVMTRRCSCLSYWRCWLHWFPCNIATSEGLISRDSIGKSQFCSSLTRWFVMCIVQARLQ